MWSKLKHYFSITFNPRTHNHNTTKGPHCVIYIVEVVCKHISVIKKNSLH